MSNNYRKIFINGLKVDAQIGVYDFEHGQTQPLLIDFEMKVEEPDNPVSDSIEDVVCYNKISQEIFSIIDEGHIGLVETLAERINDIAMRHPMAIDSKVCIKKLNAIERADAAGVEIYRSKNNI